MVTTVQPPAEGSDSTDRGEPSPDSSWVRRNPLALTCLTVFVVLLWAQSMTGWHASNADLEEHGQATVSYLTYIGGGGFAEATFESWQSEFLAVFALVVLGIFLRQRGSSQSKPVYAPHGETGD